MKTHRYILFVIACVLSIGTGWGTNATTYYYNVGVAKNPTAGGTVYIADNENFENQNTSSISGWASDRSQVSFPIYVKAVPNSNYLFDRWESSAGEAKYTSEANFSVAGQTNRPNNPTVTYTAYFKEKGCLVVDGGDGGNASISNPTCIVGETVTITAYGRYDYIFDGWEYNGEIVSKNLTMTATVPVGATSSNPAKYTATWHKNTIKYYRITNGSKYLNLVGKQSQVLKTGSGSSTKLTGFDLSASIKLVDAATAQSSAGSIFKVTHDDFVSGEYKNLVIEAQGIKTTDILNTAIDMVQTQSSQFTMANTLCLSWDGRNGYKMHIDGTNYFLQQKNSDDHVSFIGDDYNGAQHDTWYLEPVDGSTSTSSVASNLAISNDIQLGDGRYYTTLFVSFPFKCAPNMRAYYVTDVKDNVAECNTNGIMDVHEFTPVILEWEGEAVSYVTPINIDGEVQNVPSDAMDKGWWTGCITLFTKTNNNNDSFTQTSYYLDANRSVKDKGSKITFNKSTMRVLNNKDDEKAVLGQNYTSGADMPNNKAYLDKQEAKELYIVIFPLELDEADMEIDGGINSTFSEVHVVRSLSAPKDGEEWSSWATLCLPFDLDGTEIEQQFGECELKALDNFWVTEDDGTLHLRFIDATTIECGQPYMIRVKKAVADLKLQEKHVNTERDNKMRLSDSQGYTLDFQGQYVKVDRLPADAFYINTSNSFKHVTSTSKVSMKGFRAYFMATSSNGQPVRAMALSKGNEPTDVHRVIIDGLEEGSIYNLQGIRQNSMKRGVNIVNGKKILH